MRFKQMIESSFDDAKKVNCPLCGARANQMCVSTKSGSTLNTLHNERLRAAGFGSAKGFNAKAKAITKDS